MKNVKIALLACAILAISCKDSDQKKDSMPSDANTVSELVSAPSLKNSIPTVKIVPIEHASVVLEWGEVTIYVDPVGGAAAFADQKQPDLILITDIHGDHFSLETLQDLNTAKAKIMMPQAVADLLPAAFAPEIDVLNNGDSKERFGITVEAIPMYNLREEAKDFHSKGRGNGYVLSKEGERIYFSGDTEDIPEMRALKNIDMAFICMNLPYTMTEESAADAVLAFKPKHVYPYHYRGRPDVSDVVKFKDLVNAVDPEIDVVQLDWYPKENY